MNLSTKGRYAIRALTDMAVSNAEGRTALSEVAGRQSISLNYLEQIFAQLRKAGILISIKGAGGGYELNLSPNRITIQSILSAVEGDLEWVDNSNPKNPIAESTVSAINTILWEPLEHKLSNFLNAVTLEDIVRESGARQNSASDMYYI